MSYGVYCNTLPMLTHYLTCIGELIETIDTELNPFGQYSLFRAFIAM